MLIHFQPDHHIRLIIPRKKNCLWSLCF